MNPLLIKWEDKLHALLQKIDAELENTYGKKWPLHPSRPKRGTTANPQYDGLFRLTASFSAGYGSTFGSGYIFRVEIVTLSKIPPDIRDEIEEFSVNHLREGLSDIFSGRKLRVERDGNTFKIFGDLALR